MKVAAAAKPQKIAPASMFAASDAEADAAAAESKAKRKVMRIDYTLAERLAVMTPEERAAAQKVCLWLLLEQM